MQVKKRRILIVSIFVLIFAALLGAAGTFALFSDSVTKTNHLQAGSLKIGLYRTSLTGTQLEEDGTLGDYENSERIDLTKTDENVFTMTNVCPLVSQTATLEVSNLGTTAFTYSVGVINVELDTESEAKSEALAEQIEITLTAGEETETFFLSEVPSNGKIISLGTMLVTDAPQTFSVTATFVDDENNNAAMSGSLTFDLIVNAIQAIN